MSLRTSLPGAGTAGADLASRGLAIDARSLDGLRHADPKSREAIRQVAQQFEALFMRQLIRSMRDAVPRSGMFEGPGSDIFEGMLDSQLSTAAAGKGGGLASLIERQLLGDPAVVGERAGRVGAWSPASGRAFEPQQAADMAAGAALRGGQEGAGGAGEKGGGHEDARPGRRGLSAEAVQALRRAGVPMTEVAARGQADGRLVDGDGRAAGRLGPVQAAFVQQMWPHAVAAQKQTGLPAAWVVGQAALESGWGQRDIRDVDGNPSHNLFGIKAGAGWQGKTVAAMTTEYVDGVPRKSVERFRRYDSYAEAFADWARLIAGNPRYRQVAQARNAGEFAQGLAQGGYATDPAYERKLGRTIDSLLRSVGGQQD